MNPQITLTETVKPTQYVIRFTGKVSWEGQENGLPPEIYAFLIFEGNDTNEINKVLESQANYMLHFQAMFVQRNQGSIIDMRQTPAERMVVSMKWIVQIHTDMNLLGMELSHPDENGVERLHDGTEPKKQ